MECKRYHRLRPRWGMWKQRGDNQVGVEHQGVGPERDCDSARSDMVTARTVTCPLLYLHPRLGKRKIKTKRRRTLPVDVRPVDSAGKGALKSSKPFYYYTRLSNVAFDWPRSPAEPWLKQQVDGTIYCCEYGLLTFGHVAPDGRKGKLFCFFIFTTQYLW